MFNPKLPFVPNLGLMLKDLSPAFFPFLKIKSLPESCRINKFNLDSLESTGIVTTRVRQDTGVK
jgi:hypothetical protein